MDKKTITVLPTDAEVEEWFADNIGIDNNCSASSAIYKFRQWLSGAVFLPENKLCPKCDWHIIEQDDKGNTECYWCGKMEKQTRPEDNYHINYGTLVNPEELYPVIYVRRQDGTKEFEPRYLNGKHLTQPQIKYLYSLGYFDKA